MTCSNQFDTFKEIRRVDCTREMKIYNNVVLNTNEKAEKPCRMFFLNLLINIVSFVFIKNCEKKLRHARLSGLIFPKTFYMNMSSYPGGGIWSGSEPR